MKALRQLANDMGQVHAAHELGVSQGMLSQVLLGRKKFSAERAVKIERRLRKRLPDRKITRADFRPDLFGRV